MKAALLKRHNYLIHRNGWHVGRAIAINRNAGMKPKGAKRRLNQEAADLEKRQLSLLLWRRTCGIHGRGRLLAQIPRLHNLGRNNNTENDAEQMWRGIQGIGAWKGKERNTFPILVWCCTIRHMHTFSFEACRMGCSTCCCGAVRCREGQMGQMDLIRKGKFYVPLIKRVNEKGGKGRGRAGRGR